MLVLISAKAPPQPDGIGDYTSRLAEAIADRGTPVAVWTSSDHPVDPIPGVCVEQPFSLHHRRGVAGILGAVQAAAEQGNLPRALVLQFNQFSWGKWGLNPFVPMVLRRIKRRWPSVKVAVMFHEKVVPPTDWKLRIMRCWQQRQYSALADTAEMRFFSIEKWAEEERQRRPDRPAEESVHLPVGSNLPTCPSASAASRSALGIPQDTVVLGSFGSAHPSRLIDWIGAAAQRVRAAGHRVLLLHVGSGGDLYRKACGEVPVKTLGRLPADEAAACFSLMDLFLAPFSDGVSTRRGSLMAALAHGLPFATTLGPLSDSVWRECFAETAATDVGLGAGRYADLVASLVADAKRRAEVGRRGQELYEQRFCWSQTSRVLVERLRSSGVHEPSRDTARKFASYPAHKPQVSS